MKPYKQSVHQLSASYKTQHDYNKAISIINNFSSGVLCGLVMFGLPLLAVAIKTGAIVL